MTVKAITPARILNLVAPLPHKGTAMRNSDTAASGRARSSAVSPMIGQGLRGGDVDSATARPPVSPTRSIRTSTTATRTTTTAATRPGAVSSADSYSFDQLVQAFLDCRQHKRSSSSCQAFESHLERNLCALHDELTSGTYRPGRSICFAITRPKVREVWAADFRDRIVHHLLYNHAAPLFEPGFVAGSCACIPGRGTLYAARRLEHDIRSVSQNWSVNAWYLKCDLANFFVAIDKGILFGQLARRIAPGFWLELAHTVLFHDPRADVEVRGQPELLARVPSHKRLSNAAPDTGLPIGNLSSQFFANVFLDGLDQFCKHQIRARWYGRYVDDFYLLHQSRDWLAAAHDRIEAFIPATLGARLNPAKTIIQPVDRGVDFVGHVIKPWRRTTRPRTLASALQRIETMPPADLFATGNSYFGLLTQASHSHKDRSVLARAMLKRGHAVNGALTKSFRKSGSPAATA